MFRDCKFGRFEVSRVAIVKAVIFYGIFYSRARTHSLANLTVCRAREMGLQADYLSKEKTVGKCRTISLEIQQYLFAVVLPEPLS